MRTPENERKEDAEEKDARLRGLFGAAGREGAPDVLGSTDSDAVLGDQNFMPRFGEDLPDTETIPLDGEASDDGDSGILREHSDRGSQLILQPNCAAS